MSVARNAAAATAPSFSGILFAVPILGLPFIAAGSIKLVYNGAMFLLLRDVRPPEERVNPTDRRRS